MPTLADVVAVLDRLYDPGTAESWDAVGLVCGDPEAPVRRVMIAIDPLPEVVADAIAAEADLLITHHPLYLRGTSGVAATTYKGRIVHDLIRAGTGLVVAHTNADVASPGVSDALAERLGLEVTGPLRALDEPAGAAMDKLVTFVPHADADAVLDALADAGAGAIGDYRRAAWRSAGEGTFQPVSGAHPTIGAVGTVTSVPETRLETISPRQLRAAVVSALVRAHPYEEPAYDVLELAPTPDGRGFGRIGTLTEVEPLWAFAERVAAALPAVPAGVRVAGELDRPVRWVAVSGGAGDSLLDAAAGAGVDVFVTADLRHHPATEHIASGGPGLIDVGHWASEWPWCEQLAAALRRGSDQATVKGLEVVVSTRVTDPWTAQLAAGRRTSRGEGRP